MTKKEKLIIEYALDELMKGDAGNLCNVVYRLGKLVNRDYAQFTPTKTKIKSVSPQELPIDSKFKAP